MENRIKNIINRIDNEIERRDKENKKGRVYLGKLFNKEVYIDCKNMTDKKREKIKIECKKFRKYLKKKYK